jgi:phosphonate transport system substrate-binding protein
VFFPVQSNAAQIEAMRSGRLHIAGFNTGSNPLAVNCAGFRPFTIMASEDGGFGYEMEIITYPGSGIEKVEDIKGKTLAFTSETSNSGFKAPSAILKAEYGMVAGTDFEPAFSGKHDNSILGVANKDYPAAAIANSVMSRMIEREVITADQVKSIYKSQTFPTTGFGVVYNLKPELQDKIKEAFFTFPWEGSSLKKEFEKSNEGQFLEMNYKDFWDVDPQDRCGQWCRVHLRVIPFPQAPRLFLRGAVLFHDGAPCSNSRTCPRPIAPATRHSRTSR